MLAHSFHSFGCRITTYNTAIFYCSMRCIIYLFVLANNNSQTEKMSLLRELRWLCPCVYVLDWRCEWIFFSANNRGRIYCPNMWLCLNRGAAIAPNFVLARFLVPIGTLKLYWRSIWNWGRHCRGCNIKITPLPQPDLSTSYALCRESNKNQCIPTARSRVLYTLHK